MYHNVTNTAVPSQVDDSQEFRDRRTTGPQPKHVNGDFGVAAGVQYVNKYVKYVAVGLHNLMLSSLFTHCTLYAAQTVN